MTQLQKSPLLSNRATPLFSLGRGGIQEVVIHGLTCVSSGKELAPSGAADVATMVVARSLLKPFQTLALVDTKHIQSGGTGWILPVASHSGQPTHLRELARLAQSWGVNPEALRCPACYPMDGKAAETMRAAGHPLNRLCHPCAGKHLLMLAVCQGAGWSEEGYLSSDHPVQKRVRAFIESYADVPITWVQDSCGVPTAVMTVENHVKAWQRLAEDASPVAMALKGAWVKNPAVVGGEGRLDSTLAATFGGRIIAKEGADGLLVVQSIAAGDSSTAFVKLASGYNSNFLALGLTAALRATKKLSPLFLELRAYLEQRMSQHHPNDQQVEFLL